MPSTPRVRSLARSLAILIVSAAFATSLAAQQPTPEQARELLRNRPDLVQQLREKIGASGLTPDQVRARLRAAGYPENLLDPYLAGADTTQRVRVGNNILEATRNLGIVGGEEYDSLLTQTDSARFVLDSAKADSLSKAEKGLPYFGFDVFRKATTRFQPAASGPVDANYRLGPGDVLVLILTGDVELAHELEITREGFIAIPQVGQLNIANLTLGQLEDLLYARLGRVYSGVRRGSGATTKFSVTVARLRTNQVFVVGDVVRPGSYQVSSAGTALSALYAAGGPSNNGSLRRIEIRRGGKLIDSLDVYDYLLHGDNSHDVRLETGDVVFVPVRASEVKVAGKVVRPAIYELKVSETLRDLLRSAGGFDATALRRRVQIDRILPPASRGAVGRDRVLIDINSDQFNDGFGPPVPMEPGDSVTVFAVGDRRRDVVKVDGSVWVPGLLGFTPGMKLSDAIRLAGGPKPEVYLGSVLVSRLQSDSSRVQLRSALRDSLGAVTDDIALQEDDDITVFSRINFRPERYIAITGAVRKPRRLPFREGMTLRDAVLQANGLTEDAFLGEAEIARLPSEEGRGTGLVATSIRVTLDSTYLFERGPDGRYLGPPGLPAPASGAPEVPLQPYDNVLILRQPDWELQRTVAIVGQVRFPGRYGLKTRTDRLTDLIERAGGLTKEAYPAGIQFIRSANRGGRIGLDLPRILKDSTFRDNLILAGGDSVVIPEYNPVVYVAGAVNSPVAINYVPGQDLEYYVSAAGGYSRKADRHRSYVTQPTGKVESLRRRFLLADHQPRPVAGAVVFVPEKDPTDKKDFASIFGAVAQVLTSVVTIVVVLVRK